MKAFNSKRLLDPKSAGRKPILFLFFSFNQEQMQSKQCTLEEKKVFANTEYKEHDQ